MVDIVHRIGIAAPIAKVYDAVATAQGVAGWWPRDTTSAEPGDALEVQFHAPDGRPEWIGTDATFQLTEGKGMTILMFGHRGWREPVSFMALCSMKWATFLWSLKELVETGAGKLAPDDVKIDDWN